jgi:hypothetical protein
MDARREFDAVPVEDALEQSIPVNEEQEDADGSDATAPSPIFDANEADVLEQSIEVPVDDDYRDEES